jgi:hypothetical protein
MKLRFRNNSLRLRVNKLEVQALAAGDVLTESVFFPGQSSLSYVLEAASGKQPGATYQHGRIVISAPSDEVRSWAHSDAIGIYFELPADGTQLRVAIEKDLECLDAPSDERDADAFPRGPGKTY